jgi:PadR family transcriptional regulator, regulatory protein AphA
MDLRAALLGLLSWRAASGYDLKRAISDSDIFYWSGNNNQIYKSLLELQAEGLVSHTVEQQEKLPAKKIYSLTPAGQAALRQALLAGPELPELHKGFLIQLAWAEPLSDEEVLALLDQYAAEVDNRLRMAQARAAAAKWAAAEAAPPAGAAVDAAAPEAAASAAGSAAGQTAPTDAAPTDAAPTGAAPTEAAPTEAASGEAGFTGAAAAPQGAGDIASKDTASTGTPAAAVRAPADDASATAAPSTAAATTATSASAGPGRSPRERYLWQRIAENQVDAWQAELDWARRTREALAGGSYIEEGRSV